MTRKKCQWCGRGPVSCAEHGCISPHEKQRLIEFIREHGSGWRNELRLQWADGKTTLKNIRRAVVVSRSRLVNINPPTETDVVGYYGELIDSQ